MKKCIDIRNETLDDNLHFELQGGKLFIDHSDGRMSKLIVYSIPIEEFLERLGYKGLVE